MFYFQKMLASKIHVVILITGIIFSFLSCDTVDETQEEISLKGEKISNPKKEDNKLKDNDSVAYYSVNTESPKAKELNKKIKSNLKNKNNAQGKNKAASIQNIQPDLQNAAIVENKNTGSETIVTPINNGDPTIKQKSFVGYNSQTNSLSKQIYYYRAETNLSESELSALEESSVNELPDGTTLEITITDQFGNVRYSDLSTNGSMSKDSKSENPTTSGCMRWCTEKEVEEMTYWQEFYCTYFAAPSCGAAILAECTVRCLSYEF